jgi:putative membrane protein
MSMWKRRKPSVWKGLVSGVVAGLAASWTMNQFQAITNRNRKAQREDDNATVKAAERISEGLLHRRLSRDRKKRAGSAVHYAYGALVGGLYGALAERSKRVRKLAGIPYGCALWLLGDEVAVPLLRLSKGPTAYPVSNHAMALASHVVYGATADLVRRAVRTAM